MPKQERQPYRDRSFWFELCKEYEGQDALGPKEFAESKGVKVATFNSRLFEFRRCVGKFHADVKQTNKTPEQWVKIISKWARSGLSMAEFCRQEDIPTSSLHAARRKFSELIPEKTRPVAQQKARTREEWLALFAEQEGSGLSQREFCEAKGIYNTTFASTKTKIKKEKEGAHMPEDKLPVLHPKPMPEREPKPEERTLVSVSTPVLYEAPPKETPGILLLSVGDSVFLEFRPPPPVEYLAALLKGLS